MASACSRGRTNPGQRPGSDGKLQILRAAEENALLFDHRARPATTARLDLRLLFQQSQERCSWSRDCFACCCFASGRLRGRTRFGQLTNNVVGGLIGSLNPLFELNDSWLRGGKLNGETLLL